MYPFVTVRVPLVCEQGLLTLKKKKKLYQYDVFIILVEFSLITNEGNSFSCLLLEMAFTSSLSICPLGPPFFRMSRYLMISVPKS